MQVLRSPLSELAVCGVVPGMSDQIRDVGPREAVYFVDPVTGERLDEAITCDVHGTDMVGADEEGLWWGTERAAWVLHEHWAVVRVTGWIGSQAWEGWFVGTGTAARDYVERHGVRVDEVESCDEDDLLLLQTVS